MYWGDGHMGGWMWLSGLVLLGLAVAAIFLLTSGRNAGGSREERTESAEESLKRRYAQGEIDRETYRRMLDDLREPGSGR